MQRQGEMRGDEASASHRQMRQTGAESARLRGWARKRTEVSIATDMAMDEAMEGEES